MLNMYVSDWGHYVIPQEIPLSLYDANKRSLLSAFLGLKHRPVMDIKPLPDNKEFWSWLHEQDVKAGKPNA